MSKRVAFSIVFSLLVVAPLWGANEKDLQGTWIASEAKQDGEKVGEELFKGATLVFRDGKFSATLGDLTENGTFKTSFANKPYTLDLKASDGPLKGTTRPGILDLDGDTLTVCFIPATNARPADFSSTAKNKHFVIVYKRKK